MGCRNNCLWWLNNFMKSASLVTRHCTWKASNLGISLFQMCSAATIAAVEITVHQYVMT